MKYSLVSIIIVNYNGKKYLQNLLSSIDNLSYPKNNYEVIVVDNASTDGSVAYINKNYPSVKVIKSSSNIGFGKGNNLGIKNAKGDLYFLINNDTILGKDSVTKIVDTYNRWSKKIKVGAINAKLILVDRYLPILFEEVFYTDYFIPPEARPIVNKTYVIDHETSCLFSEKVHIPINHNFNNDLDLTLVVKPFRRNKYRLVVGKTVLYKGNLNKLGKDKVLKLQIKKSLLKNSLVDLIQNTGNVYFRDGYGRDRGSIIYKHKQYYEIDGGQYDKEEVIQAFCGAGVLLNKKAINDVGGFDDNFFMYYEDADLSFRMAKSGWKCIYSPTSVIRHIHAGSSVEWSPFFTFNVERNRLLFVFKHWPRWFALKQWLKYIFKDSIAVPVYYLVHKQKQVFNERFITRLRVNISLIVPFIKSLMITGRISNKEVRKFI